MNGLAAFALVAFGASPFGARFSPFPTSLPAPLAASARSLQEIPRNDGWVTDLAGFLGAERERALEARLETFRAGPRGAEIAVLTVPSLAGRPIESLALETSRAWGIGSKETQRGALLVVAREEREIRIEVGDGLEGDITDADSWRVIQKVIVPRFRQGDFAGGIEAGVLALEREAGAEPGEGGASEAAEIDGTLLVIPFVFALLVAGLVISRARRGGVRGPFGSPPLGRGRFPRAPFPGGFGGGLGGGHARGFGGGFSGGGGFRGFGGGGGFSGGGASGRW